QQGGYRRGIDSAGQERAEWHVRHHLVAHRTAQRALELDQEVGFIRRAPRLEVATGGPLLQVPVAPEPSFAIVADGEHHARLELVHAAIDALWRRYVAEAQE